MVDQEDTLKVISYIRSLQLINKAELDSKTRIEIKQRIKNCFISILENENDPNFVDYFLKAVDALLGKTYLDEGGIKSFKDQSDKNLIHCITSIKHYLADYGLHLYAINTLITKYNVGIEEKDVDGNTALLLAAKFGHKELIDTLLDVGANTQHVNDYNENILHCAASLNGKCFVDLWYDTRIKADRFTFNNNNRTAADLYFSKRNVNKLDKSCIMIMILNNIFHNFVNSIAQQDQNLTPEEVEAAMAEFGLTNNIKANLTENIRSNSAACTKRYAARLEEEYASRNTKRIRNDNWTSYVNNNTSTIEIE
jgi:hypothetical protein